MQAPNHLREQARKCRTLAKTAIEAELIEQLRAWSIDSLLIKLTVWSDAPPRGTGPLFRSSNLSDRLTVLVR